MSEDIRNAYPPEPSYIRLKFFRRMVLAAGVFYSYFFFMPAPEFDDIEGYEENVTSNDAAFEIYKLHRSSRPQSNLYYLFKLMCRIIYVIFYYTGHYLPPLLIIILAYCCCYRIVFMKQRIRAIADFYRIDYDLISEIKIDRWQHMRQKRAELTEEERSLKSKMLLKSPTICNVLNHPDLILSTLVTVSDYACLQSIYFSSWTKRLFDFADMVVIVRQMLNAVQYLHDQNIYHLDIQPKNVWVKKSVWRFRRMAILGGFEFARRSEKSSFAFDKVGLLEAFRPPEYSAGTEMDAAKFDAWSLGVIAFEAFTGGMLSVESGLMKPPVRNGGELIRSRVLLNEWYFLSALQSTWDILSNFYTVHLTNSVSITLLYDLYYDEVLLDCVKFVRCLLYHDYKLRYTVLRALEMPMMRKANERRKTSEINPFRYL